MIKIGIVTLFNTYTMTRWWCHRRKHPGSTHHYLFITDNSHQIGNFSRKHTWVRLGCFLLWHHQQVIVNIFLFKLQALHSKCINLWSLCSPQRGHFDPQKYTSYIFLIFTGEIHGGHWGNYCLQPSPQGNLNQCWIQSKVLQIPR